MNIQYASDLHLEFIENEFFLKTNPLTPGADILLLGGDILQFRSMKGHDWFFDYVSENFGVAYWIPGNHEYYNTKLNNRSGIFCEEIRPNVFLVNDYAVTVGNVHLILATMWTKIKPNYQIEIQRRMNDFHLIRVNDNRLTCEDLNEVHQQSVNFIKKELATADPRLIKIVVTHHVPTFMNYPPEYFGDVLNEAFAVNLTDYIYEQGPDYWIYGHHHQNIADFKIGKTTMLTNQLGYVRNNEHLLFDHQKTIKIIS
ncbi:metallophosphoesterase [Mucilaginibacter corticis]|uniref:Metallophosphoesterase n=1 Tax=Mucilaginibacter corticis TaxID=2597670 RepID=A0A556MLY9_9SPHI|nr:metallophosphoesterase [Mucilaginibacter corticis]TSJ40936.1 metallophosphoesterase [Mucilaginibacter corticis]